MNTDKHGDDNLERLRKAYDPEAFREQGHQLIDQLADHLSASLKGEQTQTIPWQEPEESVSFWRDFAAGSGATSESFAREFLSRSVRISDPRFLGHQICEPVPTAQLASLTVEMLNNGSGVYEMGMAGTGMEKFVIGRVARAFGFPDSADGFMTSGGTLANLTAMLAARAARGSGKDWQAGTESNSYAILVSDQAHYCVDRAIRIMGWGEDGLILVPTNDRFQMRTELLPELLSQAKAGGRQVLGVVGSACSTSTGSFDDLQAIGEFCQANDLWFHVDGAHGAALAFSETHRGKLAGIELADSVVIDFHKMMMTPVLSSALVFRKAEDSFRAFSIEAEYLFARDAGQLDQFNLARRTFECTKSVLSARVYSTFAIHGGELFEANIDRLHQLATEFAAMVESHPHFELCVEPETNIVCFRYTGPNSDSNPSECNDRIRDELIREGEYYIVKTRLHGETWLRCTVANPFTSEEEFNGLLKRLMELAVGPYHETPGREVRSSA